MAVQSMKIFWQCRHVWVWLLKTKNTAPLLLLFTFTVLFEFVLLVVTSELGLIFEQVPADDGTEIELSSTALSEDVLEILLATILLVFIDIIGSFGIWGCVKGNFFIVDVEAESIPGDEVVKGCFEATI